MGARARFGRRATCLRAVAADAVRTRKPVDKTAAEGGKGGSGGGGGRTQQKIAWRRSSRQHPSATGSSCRRRVTLDMSKTRSTHARAALCGGAQLQAIAIFLAVAATRCDVCDNAVQERRRFTWPQNCRRRDSVGTYLGEGQARDGRGHSSCCSSAPCDMLPRALHSTEA